MKHTIALVLVVLLTIITAAACSATATSTTTTRTSACRPPHDHYPFCNTSLPLDARIKDLIGRIRSDDKRYLLTARGWPQGNLTALSYLGVPGNDWGLNCVHGVQSDCVFDDARQQLVCPTYFPIPVAIAASFNVSENSRLLGRTIGTEGRALFLAGAREPTSWSGRALIGPSCWSPNQNTGFDPRWGRAQETTECPRLTRDYVRGYVTGMQNDPRDSRYVAVATTLKHWVAYDLDDSDGWTRYNFDANVSLYDLVDTHFPSFYDGIVEARAEGIMCAYSSLDGVPTCANKMLRKTLRERWNFTGYMTSDTDSVECIWKNHKYTKTPEEAVAIALRDGETDMNSGGTYATYLPGALQQKLVNESDVDRALYNTLRVRFRAGMFDPVQDQPLWKIPLSVVNNAESKHNSLHVAEQGMVLLQNKDNTLPFFNNKKRNYNNKSSTWNEKKEKLVFGFIGPSVNDSRVLLGNYLGWVCPGGSHDFTCVPTIIEEARSLLGGDKNDVLYAQGCTHRAAWPTPVQLAQADLVAKQSDVVVLVVGLDQNLEAEMHDRTSLALPHGQKFLIQSVRRANPTVPIVMVLVNGGVLAIEDELPLVDAVIEAWYPGPHGARAIMNTLLGTNNPGGKMPATVYFENYTSQIKVSDMSQTKFPGRSYRYVQVPTLFDFGFGLSYSKFDVKCSNFGDGLKQTREKSDNNKDDDDVVVISVNCSVVVSSDDVPGSEVLQVYIVPSSDISKAPGHKIHPQKMLAEYQRVRASKNPAVWSVKLKLSAFCLVNSNSGAREIVPGGYRVVVTTNGSVASSPVSAFDVTLPASSDKNRGVCTQYI